MGVGLEALLVGHLVPVHVRVDGDWGLASDGVVVSTLVVRRKPTGSVDALSLPIGAIVCVQTDGSPSKDCRVKAADVSADRVELWDEAGAQKDVLGDVITEEIFTESESVEHLTCRLAVSDVGNFVLSSLLFDVENVCFVVSKRAVGPVVLEEVIVNRFAILAMLRVLGSTLVTDPHVEALVDQLELERLASLVCHPHGTVLVLAMLHQNSWPGRPVSLLA